MMPDAMTISDAAPTTEPTPSLFWRILRTPFVRLLLSLVISGVLSGLGFFTLYKLHLFNPKQPVVSARGATLGETLQAVSALIALFVVGRGIERVGVAELGLPRARAGRQVAVGFSWGAGLLTIVIVVMALAGWYHAAGVGAAVSPFLWSVLLFLIVGIFEEVFFRGIAFRLIEQMIGTWGAVLLTAFFFGFSHRHNPNATWVSSVGIAIEAGVLLAGAYLLHRALWIPIGMHWAWNLFEGPVFGTPVSGLALPHLVNSHVSGPVLWTGGAFGPEAGLVCMILGGAFGVALMVIAQVRGKTYTPRWMLRLFGRAAEAPASAA